MAQHGFRMMVRAGLIMGVALFWPLEAFAGGAGFGGVHAAGGYGNGAAIRLGAGNGQNRAGLYRHGIGRNSIGRGGVGRSYFPTGGFGAAGYYPTGVVAPYAGSDSFAYAAPASITTRSVIIRRGPAFGEPGYVSHPAIYRLTEASSRRPGTRRFKVERIDF